MKKILLHFILFTFLFILGSTIFYFYGKPIWYPYYQKYVIHKDVKPIALPECNQTKQEECKAESKLWSLPTTTEPIEKLNSERRLKRLLADSDFVIYPKKLTLIGLKHEQLLEVWGELNGKWQHIHTYPFTGFSGRLGPKLREGDRQIPEGIYRITYLNPNSKFHLSMRVNYPNNFDKKVAKRDKRTNLGSDIMIHGSYVTTGCIPIGDDSIEELYFLAGKVGMSNIKLILAPVDFRLRDVAIGNDKYPWLSELYTKISQEMKPFISQ
ncbi:MAG: L,D-transpeptidase family protein [Epsilonproteobacteria bacterium]|nr:L,D-transpeptidase family protein [Campylobacterota bacterium]